MIKVRNIIFIGAAAAVIGGMALSYARLNSADSLAAEAAAGSGYVPSRYALVSFSPDVDLRRVNGRVRISLRDTELDIPRLPGGSTVEQQLGDKLDRIIMKVQKILDMYPRGMLLAVQFVRTSAEVEARYCRNNGQCLPGVLPAYYDISSRTVLVSEQGVTAGILSHELAHVVVSAYFGMKPPRGVDELMAQYAETHLED